MNVTEETRKQMQSFRFQEFVSFLFFTNICHFIFTATEYGLGVPRRAEERDKSLQGVQGTELHSASEERGMGHTFIHWPLEEKAVL